MNKGDTSKHISKHTSKQTHLIACHTITCIT